MCFGLFFTHEGPVGAIGGDTVDVVGCHHYYNVVGSRIVGSIFQRRRNNSVESKGPGFPSSAGTFRDRRRGSVAMSRLAVAVVEANVMT